jgi:hypothetical protein
MSPAKMRSLAWTMIFLYSSLDIVEFCITEPMFPTLSFIEPEESVGLQEGLITD